MNTFFGGIPMCIRGLDGIPFGKWSIFFRDAKFQHFKFTVSLYIQLRERRGVGTAGCNASIIY